MISRSRAFLQQPLDLLARERDAFRDLLLGQLFLVVQPRNSGDDVFFGILRGVCPPRVVSSFSARVFRLHETFFQYDVGVIAIFARRETTAYAERVRS